MSKPYRIIVADVMDGLAQLPDASVQCVVTSPPYWGLRDYQVPGQIGLEATPDKYVAKLVEVFRGVRRVLRDDGTLFLNLGDSYCGSARGADKKYGNDALASDSLAVKPDWAISGLKPKDLCMMPARVAIALQADGWWLRSDIVWHKPNPMPESCTDRPTNAHEHVFLLTKSARYYYDAEAVKEPAINAGRIVSYDGTQKNTGHENPTYPGAKPRDILVAEGRNLRNVWTIPTQPYPEAHFATFPEALPERCVKAGTSEKGCCPECGAPWERVVEKVPTGETQKMADGWDTGDGGHGTIHRDGRQAGEIGKPVMANHTTGWCPTCSHGGEPVPCTVLDLFSGSGTTGVAACKLGRRYIGIELNPEYAEMSERRIGKALKPNTYADPRAAEAPLFGQG